MAEIKITCPCCLDSKQCFEEKVDIENFSSFDLILFLTFFTWIISN